MKKMKKMKEIKKELQIRQLDLIIKKIKLRQEIVMLYGREGLKLLDYNTILGELTNERNK